MNQMQLVKKAQAGSEQAFTQLYNDTRAKTMKIALRYTRNRQDAEDLSQKSYLMAFRKLKQFEGKSSFTTWLYTIIRTQFSMGYRRLQYKPEGSTVELKAISEKLFYRRDLNLEGVIDRLSLSKIVKQLPAIQQKVYRWKAAGCTHTEVAEKLGITALSSKAHMFRVRIALRAKLLGK